MPDDSVTAAQISAAGQVAASAINYSSAASANRKGRKWAEQMYDRQRADALTDWERQNEYNSPAATMARLKAGGLNPNLVYGDGANSPSVNIRGSDSSWKPEAPKLDLTGASNSILAIAGLKNTEAQTDNLKENNKLINQQILKTAAETQAVGTQTSLSEFNLQQLKAKASQDIAMLTANVENTVADTVKKKADTQYTLDQNQRSAALNSATVAEAVQKVANMKIEQLNTRANIAKTELETTKTQSEIDQIKETINNLQTTGRLQKLDEELKKRGIQPHDPAYQRWLQNALESVNTPKKFAELINNKLRELLQNNGNWVPVTP